MSTPAVTCQYLNCTDPVEVRGYCHRHYGKLKSMKLLQLAAPIVNADLVRMRIAEHLSRGQTVHGLANRARYCPKALQRVHDGLGNCRLPTAVRIMAVPLPPSDVGIHRRLNALARIGYSRAAFARASAIPEPTLRHALRVGPMTVELRYKIVAAYETLSVKPLAAPTVIARAVRLHYFAPADWEYIDIDDPEASPDRVGSPITEDVDETAVEMLVAGNHPTVRPPRTAYVGAVAQLTVKGFSGAVIGTRLGITVRTVERMRAEIRGELAAPGQPRRPITHCKGKERHPFTAENTRIDKNGRRHCRPCETKYKASQRATVAA